MHSEDGIIIPLLCSFDLFSHARARMLRQQADEVSQFTNVQIKRRYSAQLGRAQKRIFPTLTKVHDLRGLYCHMVYRMFQHHMTMALLCMRVLGHANMTDSLSYTVFELEGIGSAEKTLGKLHDDISHV